MFSFRAMKNNMTFCKIEEGTYFIKLSNNEKNEKYSFLENDYSYENKKNQYLRKIYHLFYFLSDLVNFSLDTSNFLKKKSMNYCRWELCDVKFCSPISKV